MDKKNDIKSQQQSQENGSDLKARAKRESHASSLNYLNLFQLNPLLMHAPPFNLPSSSSPNKEAPTTTKVEEPTESTESSKSKSTELFETVLEQKLLNDTLDMIQLIENTSYDYNGSYTENLTELFVNSISDENFVQFKVRI